MIESLKRIEICLRCPVAKQMISDFKTSYADIQRYESRETRDREDRKILKEKIFIKKELPEQAVQSVNKISNILGVKGTIIEKINYLHQLANQNMKYSSIISGLYETDKKIDVDKTIKVKNYDCALMLHIVCANIKTLFEMNDNNFDLITDTGKEILLLMGQYLNECGIKCDLSKIEDSQNEEDTKKSLEIKKNNYNIYKKIFKEYCNTENQLFKFEYVNPLYIKYIENRDIPYDKLVNCEHKLFSEIVEKQQPAKLITHRINNLNEHYINIVENFMFNVPKKLTYTLSNLKALQNLSYKKIGVLLWNNENIKPRQIQSYCEDENRKVPDEEIRRLAKILLVSENALRKGYGKIYADWEYILEQQETTNIIDKISKKDKKDVKSISKTNKILLLLSQNDEDFEKMIKPYEEDINLYLRKFTDEELKDYYVSIEDLNDDVKYYYDYEQMLQTAKHPEEIEILLSVLEELQAHEQE